MKRPTRYLIAAASRDIIVEDGGKIAAIFRLFVFVPWTGTGQSALWKKSRDKLEDLPRQVGAI